MRTKTNEIYLVGFMVKPYKKKITLDVALHIPFIIACKHVWIVLIRNRYFLLKHIEYCHKFSQLLGIIAKPFVIPLELRCGVQCFHNSIERSIASIDERSRGVVFRSLPL